RAVHVGSRAVPDDARQLGDERLDRDGRQGRRHDGHRDPDRDHVLHAGEGVGAALILPAIVALVASNFARSERPRAYGLVASAGAIAVAAGPLIGGLFTTYASWRWVFVGEVVIVLAILVVARRIADAPPETRPKLDLVGMVLSALGLALIVFSILKAGSWGFVEPKPDAPTWLGLSPAIWLLLGGGVVLLLFFAWESRQLRRGAEPLIDPSILLNRTLRSGLTGFFFQYTI